MVFSSFEHGLDYIQDVAKHGLWGANSPYPPNKTIAPSKEMKPINPFGLGFMFFARFVSKN